MAEPFGLPVLILLFEEEVLPGLASLYEPTDYADKAVKDQILVL